MPSNYLVHRYLGSGTEIATLRGGLFLTDRKTLTGGPVSEGTVSSANADRRRSSSAVKSVTATGSRLYINSGGTIYVSSDEGTSVTADVSFTVSPQQVNSTDFCWATGSDGNEYLCVAGEGPGIEILSLDTTTSTWRKDSQFDGITSTQRPASSAIASWAGLVFFPARSTDLIAWFDPVTRTKFHQSVFPGTFPAPYNGTTFFILNNRLFYAAYISTTDGVRIAEFVVGSWVDTGVTLNYIYISEVRNIAALKVSDNSVLLFGAGRPSGAAGSGNPGLECAHLQISAGALTETRVTDTVVPPFLRAPATPGNSFRYSVQAFSDTLANPGSPEHYLWFDPDADSPSSLTLLKATDSATELQIIGTSQITNSWAPPGGQPSDPSTIWTPGEVSIMIVNTQPHAQGLQITYRASTAGGLPAANKTVRFRFSNIRGAPGQQCTLVPGSSSTGTIVGNDITNVIDDGTAHTVVWDFLSDGVVDGSYAHLMAEIIRP